MTAALTTALFAAPVAAQQATDSATAAAPQPMPRARASWLSDQRPLRVGDLLTIVVDEKTVAHERSSMRASGRRDQALDFALQAPGGGAATAAAFESGSNRRSDASGEADRRGDLVAVLSVRVTALEPGGLAKVHGSKIVTVDGRKQEFSLEGVVRGEDVSPQNIVSSTRVADAVITYKGKKIGPASGMLGRILSMLWP